MLLLALTYGTVLYTAPFFQQFSNVLFSPTSECFQKYPHCRCEHQCMVQGRIIIILHIICIIIVNEWSFLNWDFFRCWMELPLAGISGSREPDPPLPAAAPPAGNAPPQRVPIMQQPPLKCRVAKCRMSDFMRNYLSATQRAAFFWWFFLRKS